MKFLFLKLFLLPLLLVSPASSFAPTPVSVSARTMTRNALPLKAKIGRGNETSDKHDLPKFTGKQSISEGVGVSRFFGIVATVSALSFGSLPPTAQAYTESCKLGWCDAVSVYQSA
jgi:hypothetical protein